MPSINAHTLSVLFDGFTVNLTGSPLQNTLLHKRLSCTSCKM